MKLCKFCDQPTKPGRHKPGEYEHAMGCPNGKGISNPDHADPTPAQESNRQEPDDQGVSEYCQRTERMVISQVLKVEEYPNE